MATKPVTVGVDGSEEHCRPWSVRRWRRAAWLAGLLSGPSAMAVADSRRIRGD
jgi:hypothetical protein